MQLASGPEGKQEAGLRQPSPACQPTSSSQERFARGGKKPGGCDKWKGVFPNPNCLGGPAYQDCAISFSSPRVILFSILQEICQLQSSACLLGVQGERVLNMRYPLPSPSLSTKVGRNESSLPPRTYSDFISPWDCSISLPVFAVSPSM